MYTSSMSTSPLYSDRTEGPKPRDIEALPKETKRALLALVRRKIIGDWFAKDFPKRCIDGNSVIETNWGDLQDALDAIIPSLAYPLASEEDFKLPELVDDAEIADAVKTPEASGAFEFYLGKANGSQPIVVADSAVFDLLEYTARKVALPR